MPTNMHTPTLLTLPLELHNIIYSELLSSGPSEPLMLYNDRKDCKALSGLHPSILRSNKQIYAEAISYLYKDNTFQLEFRCDDTPHTAVLVDGEYYDHPRKLVAHTNQHSKIHKDCRCHLPPHPYQGPGPIYPHILRRLAHIELYTGAWAMWRGSEDRKSFTPTGKLVLDILKLLAEEEIEEGLMIKKTLKVEVRAKWVPDNLFLGDRGPSLSQEGGQALRAKMLALLREIRKRRVVEVKEAVLYDTLGRNVIKNVDIDTGEAFRE